MIMKKITLNNNNNDDDDDDMNHFTAKFKLTTIASTLYIKPLFLLVCSTSLENAVGKREIAHYEQFLLFLQFFLHF